MGKFPPAQIKPGKIALGQIFSFKVLRKRGLKNIIINGLSQPIYTDVLEKDTNLEGDGLFAAMMGHDGWRAVVNYSL